MEKGKYTSAVYCDRGGRTGCYKATFQGPQTQFKRSRKPFRRKREQLAYEGECASVGLDVQDPELESRGRISSVA